MMCVQRRRHDPKTKCTGVRLVQIYDEIVDLPERRVPLAALDFYPVAFENFRNPGQVSGCKGNSISCVTLRQFAEHIMESLEQHDLRYTSPISTSKDCIAFRPC